MRIYVAGSWPDRQDVLFLMNQLTVAGHTVTEWWCSYENTVKRDSDEAEKRLRKHAIRDYEGVRTADVVVACPGWFGTAYECGLADGLDIPIIYYRTPEMEKWTVHASKDWRESIFFYLPDATYVSSFDELLEELDITADIIGIAAALKKDRAARRRTRS